MWLQMEMCDPIQHNVEMKNNEKMSAPSGLNILIIAGLAGRTERSEEDEDILYLYLHIR